MIFLPLVLIWPLGALVRGEPIWVVIAVFAQFVVTWLIYARWCVRWSRRHV